METKDLDAIKHQLQQQQATLSAKAEGLRAELTTIDDQVARIEAALGVLSGTLPSASSKLTKKNGRKAPSPSASKAQVIDLMLGELSQGNVVPELDLKSRIEEKLVASGHSRMGYSLRFKEACSDTRFQLAANGISLRRQRSTHPQALQS